MTKPLLIRRMIFSLLLCCGLQASAQVEVSELIKSNPANAKALVGAYLDPVFKGFGTGINSGWNTSAKAKNTLRFELRVGASLAFAPEAGKSFDVTKIGLTNNVRPANPSSVITPTAVGPDNGSIDMAVYDDNGQLLENFSMPEGTGLGFTPAPMLQATVGLPKGIDITVRTTPTIEIGDFGSVSMFGGGVKVELLRLFSKTADKLLPFDLAVAMGYTQFNFDMDLDVSPGNATPASPTQPTDFSNQRIDAKFSGVNAEVILSKKLLFLTPFLSLGYQTAKTDAGMLGNYPVISGVNPATGNQTYTVYTDPITFKQTDISGFRANMGLQMNLAFLRIFGSYSTGEYSSFNAGVGLGIGK